MTDPQMVALLDQVQAANRDALERFDLGNIAMGNATGWAAPTPVEATVLDRLDDGITNGAIDWCDHLVPWRPAPTYWATFAPGRVRCADCFLRSAKRAARRGGQRCDGCRRYVRVIVPWSRFIPAVLVDQPDRRGAVGPLTVFAAWCIACAPPLEGGA